MNKEDMIRMAREAGLLTEGEAWVSPYQEAMERFATLIAEHEREACAKHAAEFLTGGRSPLGRAVGDAIRARGDKHD